MFLEYFNYFVVFVESLDKLTAFWVLVSAKTVSATFLMPGTPLTILSGVVLGKFLGTLASLVGNLLGAVVAFLWARYLFRNWVQTKILVKYPEISEFENKLSKNGFWTVIFLRLVPLFPFNVLNPVLGVMDIKFKDYFFGTALGIIPGTFLFVFFGESLKMLSFLNIFFALVGIFGLVFIGKFWKSK
jgi:uncharacterized membrane protein YdjX (TVP38/TMEM64 family)